MTAALHDAWQRPLPERRYGFDKRGLCRAGRGRWRPMNWSGRGPRPSGARAMRSCCGMNTGEPSTFWRVLRRLLPLRTRISMARRSMRLGTWLAMRLAPEILTETEGGPEEATHGR